MRVTLTVSVVITCFNLERFIGDAIQSVLNQRDAGEFEIVVVDDCSEDQSASIIKSYPSVKYVRTAKNSGVLLAMLDGIAASQGAIIALLDGDDVWEPEKLRRVREAFASNVNIAFVTHDLIFIDDRGVKLDRVSLPSQRLSSMPSEDQGKAVREGILSHDDYVWLGSAMSFRRDLGKVNEFAKIARAYPDPRNCYQDWPLAYWIASQPGLELAYIDLPLFRYRIHGENHSGDSRTLERARRNFQRTSNTIEAMWENAERARIPHRIRATMSARLTLAKAQVALYEGRRLDAVTGFLRSCSFLFENGLLKKEGLRFAVGTTLGPRLMTKLIARRKAIGSSQARTPV